MGLNWKRVRDQKVIREHGVEYFDIAKGSYTIQSGTNSVNGTIEPLSQKALDIKDNVPIYKNNIICGKDSEDDEIAKVLNYLNDSTKKFTQLTVDKLREELHEQGYLTYDAIAYRYALSYTFDNIIYNVCKKVGRSKMMRPFIGRMVRIVCLNSKRLMIGVYNPNAKLLTQTFVNLIQK